MSLLGRRNPVRIPSCNQSWWSSDECFDRSWGKMRRTRCRFFQLDSAWLLSFGEKEERRWVMKTEWQDLCKWLRLTASVSSSPLNYYVVICAFSSHGREWMANCLLLVISSASIAVVTLAVVDVDSAGNDSSANTKSIGWIIQSSASSLGFFHFSIIFAWVWFGNDFVALAND